ncbi:BA3454 family stress response protein [Neobacillus drentensis]
MIEVFVKVKFNDQNYYTNVIVNKDMTWENIKRIAEEQVIKQWGM